MVKSSSVVLPYCILAACSATASDIVPQEPILPPTPPHLVRDLLGFHQNLTQIESISGNEAEAGRWLRDSFSAQNYSVEEQCLEGDSSRCNILAWPGRHRSARLLMTSHYDTVPPFYPYRIRESGNDTVISGRGCVDAKGSVAAQVIAVNNLLARGDISPDDVSLLLVVGEEKGGVGMKAAAQLGLTPDVVIFGEPTERALVAGHKGSLPISITVQGRAAHSGYPWLGLSATEMLVRALAAMMDCVKGLPADKKFGNTTLNVGIIEGGVAGNVVAGSATARLDVRIARGDPRSLHEQLSNAAFAGIEPFVGSQVRPRDVMQIEMVNSGYAPVDLDADVPGFNITTVNYGTDIPNLPKVHRGQKRYLYGPGSIFVAHSDHEALTEDELRQSVDGYERLIRHALREAAVERKTST